MRVILLDRMCEIPAYGHIDKILDRFKVFKKEGGCIVLG
jgi:hypothetical protein